MTKLAYNNIFEAITDKAEAADLAFRADMMLALRDYFESKGWKQAQIVKALGIPQPRVSELMNGKIDSCSSDKLIGYMDKLGMRMKPVFVAPKRSKKPAIQCPVYAHHIA